MNITLNINDIFGIVIGILAIVTAWHSYRLQKQVNILDKVVTGLQSDTSNLPSRLHELESKAKHE